jgi:hypothetical protein
MVLLYGYRATALLPLLTFDMLTSPLLRVWSELVMDEATARDLVRDEPEKTGPGSPA